MLVLCLNSIWLAIIYSTKKWLSNVLKKLKLITIRMIFLRFILSTDILSQKKWFHSIVIHKLKRLFLFQTAKVGDCLCSKPPLVNCRLFQQIGVGNYRFSE